MVSKTKETTCSTIPLVSGRCALFKCLDRRVGNIETGEVYPDMMAPIITREDDGHTLRNARWGLPSPTKVLSKSGIDRAVTNMRKTGSIE